MEVSAWAVCLSTPMTARDSADQLVRLHLDWAETFSQILLPVTDYVSGFKWELIGLHIDTHIVTQMFYPAVKSPPQMWHVGMDGPVICSSLATSLLHPCAKCLRPLTCR